VLSASVQTRSQSVARRRQRNLTTSLTTTPAVAQSASFSPLVQPPQQAVLYARGQRYKHSNIVSLYRDEQLDQFLDSLEDISSYLDRKLALADEPIARAGVEKKDVVVSSARAVNKRTRRNLTQPIFFSNDLRKMTVQRFGNL